MVYNDEANVALEGHEGKGSGENDVQDLCLFVHKGSKAENIRIWRSVVVLNYVEISRWKRLDVVNQTIGRGVVAEGQVGTVGGVTGTVEPLRCVLWNPILGHFM